MDEEESCGYIFHWRDGLYTPADLLVIGVYSILAISDCLCGKVLTFLWVIDFKSC